MEAETLLARLAQAIPDLVEPGARLQVMRDGETIILQTGANTLQKSRRGIQAGGAALTLAGGALTTWNPWALALVPVGIALAWFGPLCVRAGALLAINAAKEELAGPGAMCPIPLSQITAVRGVYETQGWDPRSVLYAVPVSGEPVSAMILPGTDEALAEAACRALGALLDVPASYEGPFGGVKECYHTGLAA